MERSAPEYQQSGLPSPYPSTVGNTQSEPSTLDHASAAAAAPYAGQQEVRSTSYSASATPTSDYGVYPTSSRSSSFPEHIQRPYLPASTPSASSGTMAQAPTSPSVPLPAGHNHQSPHQVKSDTDVPIDPSIATQSPTYAHGQYSPYAAPPQDMSHGYQHPGGTGLYAQPRPDWTGYGQQPAGHIPPSHHVFPQTPTSAAPQHRPNQVGKFMQASASLVPPSPHPFPSLSGFRGTRASRPFNGVHCAFQRGWESWLLSQEADSAEPTTTTSITTTQTSIYPSPTLSPF